VYRVSVSNEHVSLAVLAYTNLRPQHNYPQSDSVGGSTRPGTEPDVIKCRVRLMIKIRLKTDLNLNSEHVQFIICCRRQSRVVASSIHTARLD